MKLYTDVAGVPAEMEIPVLETPEPGLFDRKIRSFLDAAQTDGPAPVPSGQILYNQAIIDGIVKSAEAGHEITIEIPNL